MGIDAVALTLVRDTPDLAAIMRAQLPDVLVTDNGSRPPIDGAWCRIETNRYFSGGWNHAVKQLRAERPDVRWAWLLNSDVNGIRDGAMERLVGAATDHGAVMVTPRVETSVWPDMHLRAVAPVLFVDCVAPLINADWFLGMGGLDETLPGWGSDIDLCYRARRFKFLVVGTERIIHPYGQTAKRCNDNGLYDYEGSCRYLLEKHGLAIRQFAPEYFRNYLAPSCTHCCTCVY